MVGQMIMGFILPFALAFVAIPLESLLHSGRTVAGHLLGLFLRTFATTLRMLAMVSRQTAKVIKNVYDLFVIPLLWLEGLFTKRKSANNEAGTAADKPVNTRTDHLEPQETAATYEGGGSMHANPI